MRSVFSRLSLFFILCFFPAAFYAALPTDVTVLTQENFRAQNYFSVAEALRGQPSLKIEQDGSRGTFARVKMRGLSSSADVLILLDGRSLSHEFDSDVDVTQIPLGMVERIEITRGGASSVYSAEAVAGVINIVTLRPEQKGAMVDLGTGVGRDGEKSVVGKIRGRSNIGDLAYTPSKEASGGFSTNEDFQTTNHFFNFTRSFNGKGFWGAEYFYHDSRVGLSKGTDVPFKDWDGHLEHIAADPNSQRTQESQHAKAFLASPPIAGGTAYATFTQSVRNSDERLTRGGISVRDEDSRASTFDLSWKNGWLDIGGQTRELKREIYPLDADKATTAGFYAALRFKKASFEASPQVRYERHSETGGFWSPRLVLLYSPADSLLLSASAQRAHRNPNFNELFYSSGVVSNPELDDEKSTNGDIGFKWSPASRFSFHSTYFAVKKTDLITASGAGGRLENGGEEKTRGIESEASLLIGRHENTAVVVTANWTELKSERTLPGSSSALESAMTPRSLGFFRIDKRMPRSMVFTNEVRYQSEQFSQDGKLGIRIPSFYTWNARFALRILAADLYFSVENITRRRYAEATAISPANGVVLSPQPERTFWIGASIRFIN